MSKDLFKEIEGNTYYQVPVKKGPISGVVEVPGSKSISNRALLMAALANGETQLTGVLFSDDSRHFLGSLISLGFEVKIDEEAKEVSVLGLGGQIPKQEARVNVGSAGTAARFITAMLAFSSGNYHIDCSEQMKKRPMKPLFLALESMGASFEYLEKEYHLPAKVIGNQGLCREVSLDISESTQFLSALLMMGPMLQEELFIRITSQKTDGSYIRVTRNMVEQFGAKVFFEGKNYIIPSGTQYQAGRYAVEPDMSAACYFYALAVLTGGKITVKGVRPDLMQGDVKFLEVLRALGAQILEKEEGIEVVGPAEGDYEGIEVNMNDFSDQTMTLAVLAPFAKSKTVIREVGHIRLQECDRMQGIVNELTRVGIHCEADGENIVILPGEVKPSKIHTYDDHRFAMAFTLLGIRTEGILIEDPLCCRKTFENYFDVMDELLSSQ